MQVRDGFTAQACGGSVAGMLDFERDLNQAVARGAVPGAAYLVLDRTGVVRSGVAGVRDTGTGAAMTLDTVFWIASMSKPITSLAAMRLVEGGALALDTPVTAVLPELDGLCVLEGADGDEPVLRPAARAPTLRELLTHTSGYAYPRWDARLSAAMKRLGLPTLPRTAEDLRRTPLVFDPGTQWRYGIGIDVVGRMIEAVTGRGLDEVVADTVCRPLGMRDTGFVLTEEQRGRAAPIHVTAEGQWVPQGPVAGRRMGFLAGGGGMFGTAPDYGQMLAELLAGAPRLLSAESWAAMTRNQIGGLRVQPMLSADAVQSVDLDLSEGQAMGWSLGAMVNPAGMAGRRAAGAQFWAGLANTYFWLDESAGLAGVLMMSLLPFGTAAALELFEALERQTYAAVRHHS